jgi:hypothetical protein
MKCVAMVSMLHENSDNNSATRLLHGEPVLAWTLRRLQRVARIDGIAVLCWDDQQSTVNAVAPGGTVFMQGPRTEIAELDRITAAQKFADGWRGGLHSTCAFDAGFVATFALNILEAQGADALLVVPAASAGVDPAIADSMIARAEAQPEQPIVFAVAAPGLAGVLLREPALKTLAGAHLHPGRLLHYMPERPMLDPVGSLACVPTPTDIARSTERFMLDRPAAIARFETATKPVAKRLAEVRAEELVSLLAPQLPRPVTDVMAELNTARTTRPVYWPAATTSDDLVRAATSRTLAGLQQPQDVRLTIGGRGDPLRRPVDLFDVINRARQAGVGAIHVETDLAEASRSSAEHLAEADIDVVSVFLPALTPATYTDVMGVDGLPRVLENFKAFVTARMSRGRGVPIVVPTFVKLAANLAEMDGWYDQWLAAVGAAVIVGPASCGTPELELADMSPAWGRKAA